MVGRSACVLGVTIEVDAPDHLCEPVWAALQPQLIWTCGADPSARYEIRAKDGSIDVVRIDSSTCELVDTVGSIVKAADIIADDAHRWVADQSPDFLLVHAGALSWRGAGLVIPGRSYSGKTTLVVALLRAGATYLSDEFAPIDRWGRVHPYPRHLSVRGADSPMLVPPSAYGAAIASGPVPLRYVVDTRYVSGASFAPEPVAGAPSLMVLADNAVVARSRPVHTMATLASLVPKVTVLRSTRGDAVPAARRILEFIDADLEAT